MSDAKRTADLLVLGGGMAGLTAAAQGAQAGLSVILAEKSATLGGAAALSEGYVWTTPTVEALEAEDPDIDCELVSVLADEFLPAVEWLRDLGIATGDRLTGIYRFGHGYRIDIHEYLDRCRALVEDSGGLILTQQATVALNADDSRVSGALVRGAVHGETDVTAAHTVLATGGFQGSPDLRGSRIAPAAQNMLLRALPESDGDGLRLAESVGADFVDGESGFYGHLVPSPLAVLAPDDFVSIAVLHSGWCLLFNQRGARFTDESLGDHANNQAVLLEEGGRALLVADEHTRREHLSTAYIPGMESYDKFGLAAKRGAHVASGSTIPDLVAEVGKWGYDAARLAESIAGYNLLTASGQLERLSPPNVYHQRPLDEPPFFAMEVQPTITFAYGGVRVDRKARVLRNGQAIPGLLAAGVDIGGVYTRAYAGSLSRGLVFGRRAALTAAAALGKEQ